MLHMVASCCCGCGDIAGLIDDDVGVKDLPRITLRHGQLLAMSCLGTLAAGDIPLMTAGLDSLTLTELTAKFELEL